jgi:hypothetical protein
MRTEEAGELVDRAGVIQEMIGEYEYELAVSRSRRDSHVLRRAKYEMAREVLIEHGELSEADRLKQQINDLDHQIKSDQALIAKLEGLLAIYREALEKMRPAS